MRYLLPNKDAPPGERGREVQAFWSLVGVGILLGMGIIAVAMMVTLILWCD